MASLLALLAASLVVASCLSVAYAREQATRARYEQSLRIEVTRERDRNAREAYLSDVTLAGREWQDANPARVRELLEATRPGSPADPDLRGFEWFYLDRLGRTPLWSVRVSESIGSSLAVGPDGAWVAVALERHDGKPDDILILDARDGKVLRKIAAPHSRFRRIAVSPDGRLLASVANDGMIALHDPATGQPLPRLPGGVPQASEGGGVSFSPDGRVLAMLALKAELDQSRSLVELWDVPASKPLASLAIPSGVSALAFSPDGSRLATASNGLWIWNVSTGKVEREIEKGEPFTDVAYSPDGRLLAGATSSGWIGLWDPATGARGKSIGGHRGEIHRIQFSPDGQWLVSAGRDRVIKFWDVPSGTLHHELRGHESRVRDLVFTHDGRRLASLGQTDGTVKLWDANRTQEATELTTDAPSADRIPVFGLAFSPDGRVLAGEEAAGVLRAWDPTRGTPLFRIEGKAQRGRGWVAIAPGSNLLAALDDERAIVLRDPSTGAVVRALESSGESRTGVFSPDGRFLVASSDRMGTIRVWDVATGRLDATLARHTQPVECLAFSPDTLKLASGGFDATVTIWDFPSRKPVLTYRGHSRGLAGLAFHPDGRSVASSGLDASGSGEIRLWDASTGRDTRILRGHAGFPRRLSFLPDGQRLASLGDDGVLKLWDTTSGREALSIAAHSRNGLGLAVSPDGQRLATSGAEGAVRIWDSQAPLPWNPKSASRARRPVSPLTSVSSVQIPFFGKVQSRVPVPRARDKRPHRPYAGRVSLRVCHGFRRLFRTRSTECRQPGLGLAVVDVEHFAS